MNRRSSMRMVSIVNSRFQLAMLGSLLRSTWSKTSIEFIGKDVVMY